MHFATCHLPLSLHMTLLGESCQLAGCLAAWLWFLGLES